MTRAQRIEAALRQLLPFVQAVQSNNRIIEFPHAPKT